ncbi:hypothetical protein [Azospirillum thermophilum]|uniref:Uncharacterized protein n=1 Tax=Azospirillum thermophilum TaxID=2202148 RepID=A0A2S2CQB4_9PROT|nr:hypothetical protein [Azospirillum thermophilum]AWK86507.1 hypothetical protein DEW08_09880 [Azospirillum thermophilum]
MMTKVIDSDGVPDALGPALQLVRAVWTDGGEEGLPERIVAWAMMIEAVDRLTALEGPAATAALLGELGRTVLVTPRVPQGALQ